ncbi:conserved Plasmodium protein, unknown function [Plasmodium berghei]|uniref:Uncharacterized protein n=2 Tax=Plasmodium berghei TaxID=5821 RepID=A0A509AGV8_PLABA|nr:conserved protein, unknown function [Plasmodium berghei ANKA]CXI19779.1 conserved Plasmodium protein, unknown function [Plasmodium berghei]SCM19880.1 conserved Plasmodium protein, unknown function [Plasmodium berghei]SCN23608.1 conserved Plasmodium protein, unknown function [Plasmodium berghei]SCO59173.1 conserved Plasmodium protein, unknown function [Plasmodium berghei]SCO59973.1 conserved Plasmodium protein, unknown function [Plasmodium berghei]|eukprot:XP_034420686.1 conserved protein, unknown function [Plasmodium berghei ANKA]
MKMNITLILGALLLNSVLGKSQISKCVFYDKRNSELKNTFYVPQDDVNMYKDTIQKLITREINNLYQSISMSDDENNNYRESNISNFDEIKQKGDVKKNKEMEEKLKYIENYRKYAKDILKNVEFKCEDVNDYESKIKCNLCIYTEIINNKHIRQGQVVQIFMNECIYGFYYYDNINQYTENNKAIQASGDDISGAKLDDIYFNITKDITSGRTDQINFFKQGASKYHPVCCVTE